MNSLYQPRQLPSLTKTHNASPEGSPQGSPTINRRNSSQIPVRKGSPSKPAPLLRSRSRDFMDAVKKFEGGKLPEKLMKTVDEERKAMHDHLVSCENDLKEIRDFIASTQEDFKDIRGRTKGLRTGINDLRNMNRAKAQIQS